MTTMQLIVRLGVLLLATVVLSLTFYISSVAMKPTPHDLQIAPYGESAACKIPDAMLTDLVTLTINTHKVLDTLNVSHVLCYGTLWGALRQGRILPWDTDIDLCAMDTELERVSTQQLEEALLEKDTVLEYDWTTGSYHLSFRGVHGHLHTFTTVTSRQEDDDQSAVPGGWAKYLWRLLGQTQFSCPVWLLTAPFNSVQFHGHRVTVPHDDMELLKYQYPDNWWLEVKPNGCV